MEYITLQLAKRFISTIFCIVFALHCTAQAGHIPPPDAKKLNDKAVNSYMKFGRNPDSLKSILDLLDGALNIDSNYLIAWTNKLSFQCQLTHYDSALITSKKINDIFPNEIDIIFFSGVLSFKTGKNEEATNIFNSLLKIYDKIADTVSSNDYLSTTTINKAVALKLLGRDDECKQVLVHLSMKEHDLAVRRHINSYINKSKDDIINEMIAAR